MLFIFSSKLTRVSIVLVGVLVCSPSWAGDTSSYSQWAETVKRGGYEFVCGSAMNDCFLAVFRTDKRSIAVCVYDGAESRSDIPRVTILYDKSGDHLFGSYTEKYLSRDVIERPSPNIKSVVRVHDGSEYEFKDSLPDQIEIEVQCRKTVIISDTAVFKPSGE